MEGFHCWLDTYYRCANVKDESTYDVYDAIQDLEVMTKAKTVISKEEFDAIIDAVKQEENPYARAAGINGVIGSYWSWVNSR